MAKSWNTIATDGLYDAIGRILDGYAEDVSESLDVAADQLTNELLEDIKADSPAHHGKLRRKGKDRISGTYRRSWKRKRINGRFVIYNTQYGLTYLLENGHALKRGGRTIGKVTPHPHILANAAHITERYEEMAVDIISGGVRLK